MHDKDKRTQINKVYSLKLGVQSLAVQFKNNWEEEENAIDNTDYGGKLINGYKIAPKILQSVKCMNIPLRTKQKT